MKGKIAAISVISILLVVGAVVGVVVVVKHNKSSKGGDHALTGSMKMVSSICERTSFKEQCSKSLESASKNSSATAKDYLLSAIHYTIEEAKKGMDTVSKIPVNKDSDTYSYDVVQSCMNNLDAALDSLNDTLTSVMDTNTTHTLQERAHELLSWVTAVHAMQSSCLDFIPESQTKSAIQNGINTATELAHNAVNIISDMPGLLSLFGLSDYDEISPSPSPSHRRLLTADGFPTWFSASDRKLLAKNGGSKGQKNNHNNNHNHNSNPKPNTNANANANINTNDKDSQGYKNKNNEDGHDKGLYVGNSLNVKPNVVVAQDGSGNFKTIQAAVNACPINSNVRFIIHVKAGVYQEQVTIQKMYRNIFMFGDGIARTVVTGKTTCGNNGPLDKCATFSNEAFGFIARGMTFRNEAGPQGHQALAFRNRGDKTALFDCSFEGNQDTLYYQALRQYYRNCAIYGTIDFIFGRGDVVIQDSDIIVRKPMDNQFNAVTADGKQVPEGSNGLVIQHCRIIPDKYLADVRFKIRTYLARPWQQYSKTVFMQNTLGDFIRPEGFTPFANTENHLTSEYIEFANQGPGNKTEHRDRTNFRLYKHISDPAEAHKYAAGPHLNGNDWLPHTGLPYRLDL